jgi:osmotically-inducible protein OsmY
LGAAAVWYFGSGRNNARVQSATNQAENAVKSAGDTIQEKLRVMDLRPQDIKDELARSGQVVRRKAKEAGQAIADATADARVTTAIKGKLVANRDLSALSISVNTTAGVVTLSGTVNSPDDISKAMMLAMETDGVKEVISTLQVKPHQG